MKRSTVSDVLNGKRRVQKPMLESLLAVWPLPDSGREQIWETWHRLAQQSRQGPLRAGRFDEASPRELGIHAAIGSSGAHDELPSYVRREFDDALEEALAIGADRGCFVTLVGGSSTGKTRSLYEAIHNVVPNWWLVQPSGTDEILSLLDEPTDGTILWLDEMHRFLGATPPLTRDVVRILVKSRMIVVGTLWSEEYTIRKGLRRTGSPDKHADDRALLEFAQVISVPAGLVSTERTRAREIAEDDERIRIALDSSDAGLTQVLAAGPDLVHRWEQAPSYAKAVITVAADARRLGVHAPLPPALLRRAMFGYLRPVERVSPPDSWLAAAIPYAEAPLHGTIAALSPMAGQHPGILAGYVAADYLAQHVKRVQRDRCPPDSLWEALIDGVDSLDDLRRLWGSASVRMRHQYAERALRRLCALQDGAAFLELARLLTRQDRLTEAVALLAERVRTAPGDVTAATEFATTVVLRDRAADLRGDPSAQDQLWELLHDGGRTADLRARAEAGDSVAADDLAELLAEEGCLQQLQERADAGHRLAADLFVELLAAQARVDELGRRAEAGDEAAARRLAGISDGVAARKDESIFHARLATLRAAVDAGESEAADQLTGLLFEFRREVELRTEVDAGTPHAAERLLALLNTEHVRGTDLHRLRAFGLRPDGSPAYTGDLP
ncbi:hypothetical protein ACWCHM_03705 [Micromonospora sp. SCSIO 07396]